MIDGTLELISNFWSSHRIGQICYFLFEMYSNMTIEQMIRNSLRENDSFKCMCTQISAFPCTDTRMVKNKKKMIGDLWEAFCKLYLERQCGFQSVLFLHELSDVELKKIGMKKRDVGIDLVAIDATGNPIAVQCKFRSRGNVTWRDVSTFDALCSRTGPWHSHLVMTNADRVVREGCLHPKDRSMTRAQFSTLARHEWLKLGGYGEGNVCGGNASLDMRGQRLKFFESKIDQH